jgi:hypothetical protein
VQRGARPTLIVGAALAAIALAGAARVDAHTVNLGLCPGSCVAPAVDDPPAATNHAAARVTLSRSGGTRTDRPNDPGPALVFERRAPPVLASGSPAASADAPGAVAPYDYFEDFDVPLPAGAWAEVAAASFFLFAPSLLERLAFMDGLSADPPPM